MRLNTFLEPTGKICSNKKRSLTDVTQRYFSQPLEFEDRSGVHKNDSFRFDDEVRGSNKQTSPDKANKESLYLKLEQLSKKIDPVSLEKLVNQIDEFTRIGKLTDSTGSEIVLDVDFADGKKGCMKMFYDPNGKMAQKEIRVTQLAQESEKLKHYVVNILGTARYGDYSLLVTKDVRKQIVPVDPAKLESYRELSQITGTSLKELLVDPLMHRMYVTALFNTHMKKYMAEPIMSESNAPDFIEFEDILHNITHKNPGSENILKKIERFYRDSVDELREMGKNPTILALYDGKSDNWFGQEKHFAADFGLVQPGNEYRDVVRPLVDTPAIFNGGKRNLKYYVNAYLFFRQNQDPNFMSENEFYKRCFKSAVVESTRIARLNSVFGKSGEVYLKTLRNCSDHLN